MLATGIPLLTDYNELRGGLGGKEGISIYLGEKYPEMTNLLMDLISCESGFNPSKCGDGGLSCGILQYKEETFLDNCQGEWKDSEDQIDCAVKMIKAGEGSGYGGWFNCWRIQNLFKYGY